MSDFMKSKLAKESIQVGSSYLEFLNKHSKDSGSNQKLLFKTNDEKMIKIQDVMRKVSQTSLPVMICGEKGVGKQFLANIIHQISTGRNRQLINIDCAEATTASFEEKLFGLSNNPVENAFDNNVDKGSLILDCVSYLNEPLQLKLLDMMKEKKIKHSKTNQAIPFNLRVMSLTTHNSSQELEKGRIKQDLYYRLYVVTISIPPLRERKCDIELLANEFVDYCCKKVNKKKMKLSSGALKKLTDYSWPNNVSELKKVVEKAVAMNMTDEIGSEHIKLNKMLTNPNSSWMVHLPVGETIKLLETHFILKTLEYHKGNRTHTAKTLGISLRTLRNKLNEFSAAGFCVPISLRQKSD